MLLHHAFGEVNGKRGIWGHAIGGMGAITQAMAREAMAHGARIETDSPVQRVLVEKGKRLRHRTGRWSRGARARIVANVNPRFLYLNLLDAADVDPDVRERMQRYRAGSASFPHECGPVGTAAIRQRCWWQRHPPPGILIGPTLQYMDRAHADARRAGMSREPVIEMLIPSTLDDSLAPAGTACGQPVLPALRAPTAQWSYLGTANAGRRRI